MGEIASRGLFRFALSDPVRSHDVIGLLSQTEATSFCEFFDTRWQDGSDLSSSWGGRGVKWNALRGRMPKVQVKFICVPCCGGKEFQDENGDIMGPDSLGAARYFDTNGAAANAGSGDCTIIICGDRHGEDATQHDVLGRVIHELTHCAQGANDYGAEMPGAGSRCERSLCNEIEAYGAQFPELNDDVVERGATWSAVANGCSATEIAAAKAKHAEGEERTAWIQGCRRKGAASLGN